MENGKARSLDPAVGPTSRHYEPSPVWQVAGIVLSRWRLIGAITLAATVVAVLVALLLPREYAAEARVLRPEGGGMAGFMGMMPQAGGLSRLLLGGGGGDYTRYLAILNSRSLREAVIDEFDLVSAYDVAHKDHPREAALERLDKNLEFKVSLELHHLSVIAYDRDPDRAARMSNFVVSELNQRNARLSSEDARQTRIFVETRLNESRAALDSARAALQDFQETHGLVELEGQAQAFLSGMAQSSGRLAELEVRHQTLLAQYGEANPQVIAARDALTAARRQMASAFGGGDALMPVALRQMPALSRRYAELLQEQMIQAQIIEAVFPILEQAQFHERNEMQAVQVLDPAVRPTQPARPSRRMIVLVAFMSAGLLSITYVLAIEWLRQRGPAVWQGLQLEPRRERTVA